jgi:5-methyltetrahydrofolate--homocysteine methyltransferase
MPNVLDRFMQERDFAVADGGIGTGLFARGLATGDAPELWNVEHPDRVRDLHAEFVAAGSDILLTNSFGGNAFRLKLHEAQDRVGELNSAAAAQARAAADASGRPMLVAGSMGPTGELFAPLGAVTAEAGRDAFAAQAQALVDGGADLLWIETMSSREEAEAAMAGAATTGQPFVATMTFDTAGRTMMGLTPDAAYRFLSGFDPPPAAIGANCGLGAAENVASLLQMAAAAPPEALLIAKANCGIPQYVDGGFRFTGTPELMATYACMVRDVGARIIGGCCGTTGVHLAAMVAALHDHVPGPRPGLAAIEAALGPVQKPAEAEVAPERRRRRRRG